MISREEALELVTTHSADPHLVPHALETEAVLRALAVRLDQDPQLWSLTGLLHDLDYSATKDTPEKHGLVTCEMLADRLPEEALKAIRAHNGECTGTAPESLFDYALRCGETVTGLIHANALVRPEGMDGMKPKSLKKKMKEKAFAANINRDNIRECEKIGLDQGEFFQIAIDAIAPLAPEVGLVK
ncbi:HD domain-containing protein [Paucidesulfovibrio longus]|uniref:HD domain-containing protein n=1 Tax=Paucidesulfovibrio longus TaxID=889 RepID=UPI0003B4263C|nr:HD domain-containing protein [Paucidesulfovibrio longus]